MPDEPRLPTEEELRTLPRWAVVAYAARCARRVQPLFTHYWPDAPREHVEAVDRAITLAEAAAADPASASDWVPALAARSAANAAANAAAARSAARSAANAAANAALNAAAANPAAAALTAANAAHATAANPAAAANAAALAHAARRDFDLLRALAEQHGWTDDSPVDVALLGPLWPDGLPEGWPVGADRAAEALDGSPLSLYFDADEFTPEQIADMIGLLSDLYAEIGGDRLIIDSTGILQVGAVQGVSG
jgi:hypothetical protein